MLCWNQGSMGINKIFQMKWRKTKKRNPAAVLVAKETKHGKKEKKTLKKHKMENKKKIKKQKENKSQKWLWFMVVAY